MRISDWSSDVCSSDLSEPREPDRRLSGSPKKNTNGRKDDAVHETICTWHAGRRHGHGRRNGRGPAQRPRLRAGQGQSRPARKSVVEGKSVSVSVDHGGGRIIKKKKN